MDVLPDETRYVPRKLWFCAKDVTDSSDAALATSARAAHGIAFLKHSGMDLAEASERLARLVGKVARGAGLPLLVLYADEVPCGEKPDASAGHLNSGEMQTNGIIGRRRSNQLAVARCPVVR